MSMNKIESDEYMVDVEDVKNDEIQDLISTLNNINHQLGELTRIKEALEPKLASLLSHGEDGSKTYAAKGWKVTVKTGFIYTLNKEEYELTKNSLPACFHMVRTRLAYDLDKSVIRDAEKYASPDELELISRFISKKPSKLNIRISAGV